MENANRLKTSGLPCLFEINIIRKSKTLPACSERPIFIYIFLTPLMHLIFVLLRRNCKIRIKKIKLHNRINNNLSLFCCPSGALLHYGFIMYGFHRELVCLSNQVCLRQTIKTHYLTTKFVYLP
jgi:hypothetical protein